jgi:hypothetical protein
MSRNKEETMSQEIFRLYAKHKSNRNKNRAQRKEKAEGKTWLQLSYFAFQSQAFLVQLLYYLKAFDMGLHQSLKQIEKDKEEVSGDIS